MKKISILNYGSANYSSIVGALKNLIVKFLSLMILKF